MISDERLQGIEDYLKRPSKDRKCIGSLSDPLAKELLKEIRELRAAGVESRRATKAIGARSGEFQTALVRITTLDTRYLTPERWQQIVMELARDVLAGVKPSEAGS